MCTILNYHPGLKGLLAETMNNKQTNDQCIHISPHDAWKTANKVYIKDGIIICISIKNMIWVYSNMIFTNNQFAAFTNYTQTTDLITASLLPVITHDLKTRQNSINAVTICT